MTTDLIDININNVSLGRSGKGGDMLVVDNYLYHYDDRGAVRNNEYRWVCAKRKQERCRSRLVTRLVNDDDEDPRHLVEKIIAMHTHDRSEAAAIQKILNRKKEADAQGALSFMARKRLGMIQPPKKRQQQRSFQKAYTDGETDIDDDDDVQENVSEADSDDYDSNMNHSLDAVGNVVEIIETNHDGDTEVSVLRVASNQNVSMRGDDKLNKFLKDKIYMLHTKHGREIACLEGFLYKVQGKSKISETFRWECIRKDVLCSARIYTERTVVGHHILKQGVRADMHKHESYTPAKLKKLMNRHNISLVVSDNEDEDDYQDNFEEFFPHESEPPQRVLRKPQIIRKVNTKPKLAAKSSDAKPRFKVKHEHAEHLPDVKIELDPLAQLIKSKQCASGGAKEKISDNLAQMNRDYFFLPSAKGNKVLCLYNFIYHFDSRGPKGSKRCYWTCLLRRNKEYHCNGRIITEDDPGSENGLRIVRVSGEHHHPDSKEDIEKRFNKSHSHLSTTTSFTTATVVNPQTFQIKSEEVGEGHSNSQATSDEKLVKFDDIEKAMAIIIDENGEYYSGNEIGGEETAMTTHSADDEQVQIIEEVEEYEDDGDGVIEVGEHQYHKSHVQGQEEEDNMDFNLSDFIRIAEGNESKQEDVDEGEYVMTITSSAPEYQMKSYRRPGRPSNARSYNDDTNNSAILNNMDITKVSRLRSAKGGFLLCIDGYIYYLKREQKNRTYWDCIKTKDNKVQCRSRAATVIVDGKIKVTHVTNEHTHGISEYDIKRRLYNEVIGSKGLSKNVLKPMDVIKCNLADLSSEYAEIIENARSRQTEASPVTKKEFAPNKRPQTAADVADIDYISNYVYKKKKARTTMKLYAVSDGPPSLAVRMTLKALNIPFELHSVDYVAAEHMTEKYAKMNPQKEIPVLDDNGFFLSESIAIMQYLCDKYAPDSELYPKDATARALVNHRLCFNMGFYYASISMHAMAPIFFDYPRNEMSLKKVNNALSVFETYLQRSGTKYAAANHLTIADFALASATLCLEGINFDLSPYPLVKKWYETFKREHPALWEIGKGGMAEIAEFEKNPPDLSHMNHPFHPTRKPKA